MRGTCYAPDCLNPVDGHGLCSTHRKRQQRGTSLETPKVDKSRTPFEVALDASLKLADVDSEDDAKYASAKDNWRKAILAYARRELGEAVRVGVSRRRRAGLKIGRPPRVTAEQARAALEQHGGVRPAARALGISRAALKRALR